MSYEKTIIDEIVGVVESGGKISPTDFSANASLDPASVERILTDQAYSSLVASFVIAFKASESGKDDETWTKMRVATTIAYFENVLRTAIAKAVKARLEAVDFTTISIASYKAELEKITDEIGKKTKQVDALVEKINELAGRKSVDEYRRYLLYAGDKWGNEKERKAVESLVKKIR